MIDFASISERLPSVVKPVTKLNFNAKMKWTLIILILYFVLGSITVFGINENAVMRFDFLEIVFGSKFGSLITLGIGPIVTASIILQLLVGSKILDWDLKTEEGKTKFTGTQKILTIFFCVFEALAYVMAGAIPAAQPFLIPIVILQLALGGILIVYMDEVCSKWGIGSGVSLFIAAGVAKTLLVGIFSPIDTVGGLFFLKTPIGDPTGALWDFIIGISQANFLTTFYALLPVLSLITVFLIVVYAQAMKIEIPMAFSFPFGSFARRWPLKFIYTSNIPVILTAAVIANLQVIGQMLSSRGLTFFGVWEQGQLNCSTLGLICLFTAPNSVGIIITLILIGVFGLVFGLLASYHLKKNAMKFLLLGSAIGFVLGLLIVFSIGLMPKPLEIFYSFTYMLTMISGSVLFSIFWVNTAGMDAKSVADQFESSNLAIPGFRRDPRIIERVLSKYIPSLAVLGGAFVGFLAGFADLTHALGTGTGILLTVMIIFQFYEQISAQHMEDMHPAVKKFMAK